MRFKILKEGLLYYKAFGEYTYYYNIIDLKTNKIISSFNSYKEAELKIIELEKPVISHMPEWF